ncbi:MAG: divergent polysaccharide deacetylase family protein [Acidobacteriota bacterium]
MSQPNRPRLPRKGRPKVIPITIALVLFATGLYVGVQLAKPPPRPDFSNLPKKPTGLVTPESSQPANAPPATDPNAAEAPSSAEELPETIERQPPPGASGQPRISIVIDDLGRSMRDVSTLLSLGVPLTYSVLPFESKTPEVVAELNRHGVELLCHLPMEAKSGANPGPGALLLSMTPSELTDATRRALAAVPGAVGVNNHMGSGMLADRDAITTVLGVVAEHRLYFLDSRTAADTVGYSLARQLGMPAGERQIFLDTERSPEFIRAQFEKLRAAAQKRGGAIAIGHPYPETLEILATAVPEARAAGFEFVPASALIEG